MNPENPYGQPNPGYQPQQPQQPQLPQMPQQPVYAPGQPMAPPPVVRKPSKVWLVLGIVFITLSLALAGALTWALINYFDQKDNVDTKVSTAVAVAVKDQADKDAAAFLEKEKQPNRQFAGPDDFGQLSFDYPKTWSIYVAKDANEGGAFAAYFNPVIVPAIANDTQYALRVTIESKDYAEVLDNYESLVKKGDLKSSAVKADGQDGTRLDGNFTKDIRGSAVVFKIRDKTAIIRSDADTFKGDFDALIKTITFNE